MAFRKLMLKSGRWKCHDDGILYIAGRDGDSVILLHGNEGMTIPKHIQLTTKHTLSAFGYSAWHGIWTALNRHRQMQCPQREEGLTRRVDDTSTCIYRCSEKSYRDAESNVLREKTSSKSILSIQEQVSQPNASLPSNACIMSPYSFHPSLRRHLPIKLDVQVLVRLQCADFVVG